MFQALHAHHQEAEFNSASWWWACRNMLRIIINVL